MKIIKQGKRIFKELYRVEIYECECMECGAIFEAQYGEIGPPECGYYSFPCPYCNKYHSNYGIGKVRDEWLPWSKVIGYGAIETEKKTITEEQP